MWCKYHTHPKTDESDANDGKASLTDLKAYATRQLECLVSSLSSSSCDGITDITCLCNDVGYAKVADVCILSNCTVREALVVKNQTWVDCGYTEPNENTTIIALCTVLFTLQTIFFLLRILCRAFRISPWGLDDTTIVIAFFLTTAFLGAAIAEESNGIGRNIWTLNPDQITSFFKVFLIFEVVYGVVLALIKISICFLYLRLFPGPKFRLVVWATQAFNLALMVTSVLIFLLSCMPLSFFWNMWDRQHDGHCININGFAWAHAGINIALDVWMLALPASQVWKLNVNRRRKVGILAMFGFGLFLTAVSICRLGSITVFNTADENATKDLWYISVWSTVEITAGLMVACMPAARLFVWHCIHRASGKTHSRSRLTELYDTAAGRASRGVCDGGGSAAGIGLTQNSGRSKLKKPYKGEKPGSKKVNHRPLGSSDLDKNRRYSMRVDVTSTGRFDSVSETASGKGTASSPTVAGSERERKDSPAGVGEVPGGDDYAESEVGNIPRTGEYLGFPEEMLAASSRAGTGSEIWVRQDVSVVRSSLPSRISGLFAKGGKEEKQKGLGDDAV